MPETIDLLEHSALTAMVNEIKSPNSFLGDYVYSNHETKPTEKVEIGVLIGSRKIAPFVRKNAEAVLVDGHSERFDTVEAPNIRIKRAFTPSELLFKRRPGGNIFVQGQGEVLSAAEAHVMRDMQRLADMATNALEWEAALSLRAQISYSVSEEENYTITFPRDASHNVDLAVKWDDPDPTLPAPEEDFLTAKELIHNDVGLPLTDAFMGQEAAFNFRRCLKAQATLVKNWIEVGNLTLVPQFQKNGALLLGQFCGVYVWQYSRSADLNGTDTPMIRSKYVEFISNIPAAEFTVYYGAIADVTAMRGGQIQTERFSKSWETPDPSQLVALLHTRPVTVPRRPNSTASFKVVSGA